MSEDAIIDPLAQLQDEPELEPEPEEQAPAPKPVKKPARKPAAKKPTKVKLREVVPAAPVMPEVDDDDIEDGDEPEPEPAELPMQRYHVTLAGHMPHFGRHVMAQHKKGAVSAYQKEMHILSSEHRYVVTSAPLAD